MLDLGSSGIALSWVISEDFPESFRLCVICTVPAHFSAHRSMLCASWKAPGGVRGFVKRLSERSHKLEALGSG